MYSFYFMPTLKKKKKKKTTHDTEDRQNTNKLKL